MAEPKVVIVAVIQCQARSFASPVPIAVACALVGTGALVISCLILDRPQLHTAVNALNLLIALAAAVCLMTAVGTLSLLRPRADRFGAVITMGWPLLGMAGAVALLVLLFSEQSSGQTAAVSPAWFFIGIGLTAVFEEVLFRGTVLPVLAQSGRWPLKPVLSSAALFAAAHLIALFGGEDVQFVATVTQVLYTFCIGVLLAAIMLSTRNLWIPITLHLIFNVFGDLGVLLNGARSPDAPAGDMSLPVAGLMVVLALPMLVVGLRIARRLPETVQ
ncbi:CPBP family intramembrane glutamic endopeptidase [Brevibacterium luteolum]|uniref:lysostaphin resistance A-like protein n=1 Tax=Brevibacterium luteolum TaxID=199591 RepID=UPI00387A0371